MNDFGNEVIWAKNLLRLDNLFDFVERRLKLSSDDI